MSASFDPALESSFSALDKEFSALDWLGAEMSEPSGALIRKIAEKAQREYHLLTPSDFAISGLNVPETEICPATMSDPAPTGTNTFP